MTRHRPSLTLAFLPLAALLTLVHVTAQGPASQSPADADAGFRSIFNGRDLTGWNADTTFWSVQDGAIFGECTPEKQPKHNTFCIWADGEVDDFELKARFKIVGGNSGIQFRSKASADWIVGGYQADMDGGNEWTGANYEERGRGILARCGERTVIGADGKVTVTGQVGDRAQILAAVHKDDWNEYHITAIGNHIVEKVNGVVTCEFTDEQPERRAMQGVLALQMHAGFPHFTVAFKDLRLKRLPLSDGRKKIVIVAGNNSHGPGEHEFEAGVYCLRRCLDKVPSVIAADYYHGWPADPTAFDNADAVISYADGGGGHPFVQQDHLAIVDALVKKGVGVGFCHYAVEVQKENGGSQFLQWIGGYYESGFSANPIWDARFKTLPEHPVTRGVLPFGTRDEWYFNMRFRPDEKGVVPILQDQPSDATRKNPYSGSGPYAHIAEAAGRLETVMWVVDNPGANRGFGFTGGHYHKNWADENQRKLVLNAMLWIARAEVPAVGVVSDPTDDELNSRLRSRLAAGGAQDPRKQGAKPAAMDLAKAKFASKVVTADSVAIDVDITGAKELYLVVADGGDGNSCDWADWIDPVLVSPAGETRLTDLKWTSAATEWGEIQVGKNAGGGAMKVAGQPVSGIGVHAASVLAYNIAGKGFTRFKARGGVDNGGTDQGNATSVQFLVFTEKPPKSVGKASGGSRGLPAADSVAAMTVAAGCEAKLWASEPMLTNPTNIDIDAKGRVWVCEGVNYRQWQKLRPEGDRILVLEDTDNDGTADKTRVFYQGPEINAALGICVLGDKVIVSCSPDVYVFTDNGEGKPPTKERVLSGIHGQQHDHGMHAFLFGPDGKLYGNFGNEGQQLQDRDGKPVVDLEGNTIIANGHPYRQGMVFRCNPDFTDFEVLGNNFRNNYEVTVDSFGTLWQSDNDDDGNQGVRINYVMEHGNFGYTDEMTGAGWNAKRTNQEVAIPARHWHQNDPGVVPNLLITGGGSPTGILVYEGTLLPPAFQGQMIHCDAGPNVVRAYPVTAAGAGYQATVVDLIKSKDRWFRPSDCAVAPDGAVFVADWFDPGVGGHQMGDHDPEDMGGRIYRVAPTGNQPKVPKLDLDSVAGAIDALCSPNLARRYAGWTRLHELGAKAEADLLRLWKGDNPRWRARALHLLARIPGKAQTYVEQAIHDANADLRITGLRIAGELGLDAVPLVRVLVKDPSPMVRRQCALSLRSSTTADAAALWAELAVQHDGEDRWNLEALGIGAARNEDACFAAWQAKVGEKWNTKAGRDIVWRSRSDRALDLLVKILLSEDGSVPEAEQAHFMRAFDFHTGPAKTAALKRLVE
jgi:putative membrane-bound dehydrogenase-like protein